MPRFQLRSPPLVFDRVHRQTGVIERVCILSNHAREPLEVRLEFDFPEHSWVQLYRASGEPELANDGVGRMALAPGENELVLALNTDSFHFPERPFRGRLWVVDATDEEERQSLEIVLESVRELEPFLGFAAIDLGTSSSTVALYDPLRDAEARAPWSPRAFRGEATTPSAVYVQDFDRFRHGAAAGALAGHAALEAYRTRRPDDPRCLLLGTKRLVGTERVLAVDAAGKGGHVDPLDVLLPLGRHVRQRAQNHPDVRGVIRRLSVTFPPTWTFRQIECWKGLFRRMGFTDDELDFSLDEASAAGLFYIYQCVRERDALNTLLQDLLPDSEEIEDARGRGRAYHLHLLCLDLGGGTTDIAFVRARLEVFSKLLRVRLELVDSDSLEYGGDLVTLVVFRALKRRIAMALADPSRLLEERSGRGEVAAAQTAEYPAAAAGGGRLFPEESESFVLPDSSAGGQLFTDPDAAPPRAAELVGENWGYIEAHIAAPELDEGLEDAIEELFPTRFLPSEERPCRVDARRNFDWLWDRAETLKRALCDEVRRSQEHRSFPDFEGLDGFRRGITLEGVPDASVGDAVAWGREPVAETVLSVGADEVWSAIEDRVRGAVSRAGRLRGEARIDRVVLSGQSSKIPMVRWLLTLPAAEGGLGVPTAKIDFDEANAKAGVSKGACLLHVMREALVGFEVDVADFRAHLTEELYHLEVDGSRRVLFEAGPLDELRRAEETSAERPLPRFLAVFQGEGRLLGHFVFSEDGQPLPPVPPPAGPGGETRPSREELLALREQDPTAASRCVSELLRWTERERIAWMEESASPGTPERPVVRFYCTRNRSLLAVHDRGPEGKTLHTLRVHDPRPDGPRPEENPFSGRH